MSSVFHSTLGELGTCVVNVSHGFHFNRGPTGHWNPYHPLLDLEANGLSIRSMVSGEVTATMQASVSWTKFGLLPRGPTATPYEFYWVRTALEWNKQEYPLNRTLQQAHTSVFKGNTTTLQNPHFSVSRPIPAMRIWSRLCASSCRSFKQRPDLLAERWDAPNPSNTADSGGEVFRPTRTNGHWAICDSRHPTMIVIDGELRWTCRCWRSILFNRSVLLKFRALGGCFPAAQDEHKTLGEQGVDPKGEVQYTVADFSVGTKPYGGQTHSHFVRFFLRNFDTKLWCDLFNFMDHFDEKKGLHLDRFFFETRSDLSCRL